MYDIMAERYWWPTMRRDITEFCKSCLACQLQKAVFNREPDLRGHLTALAPRTCWSMDCTPNMPLTGGNGEANRSNILICVDDFSKFCLLAELPQLTSAAVREWVTRNILYMYGKPRQIRTDAGSEFKGWVSELCGSL